MGILNTLKNMIMWGQVMFKGEKSGVFWWGLIIFGLAVSALFIVLWYMFIFDSSYYSSWRFFAPWIFAGAVFLLIGFYMMKSGTKK